ncbi:MAG: TIGR03915 family putative DNA repair protein [Lachnospiraceae bacterium]|nr:TIGR03915 family putative DNA repair protein [Lachnospiraceae bacterium]
MSEQIVLRCENSMDGIFTAIYDAFVLKKQMGEYTDSISISIGEGGNYLLFAREVKVDTDGDKANKTVQTIQSKLGFAVYRTVFGALCHYDEDRATVVLGYLVRAFSKGSRVWECLADPYVIRVMELSRKVSNESEKFMGFLRFRDVGGFLFSEIEPKCDVIQSMREHFEDRYPNENFIIYDARHKYALVHPAFRRAFFVEGENILEQLSGEEWTSLTARDEYEELWKQYFASMGIEARENERCQSTLLPKWYRKHMLEFVK